MRAIIDTDYYDVRTRFVEARVIPLCGWDWLEQNLRRAYPEQTLTIFYKGQWVAELSSSRKHTKKGMKEIIKIAQM